ncbi:MAG: diguanylate cyclase [Gammaproteobacteria bacterium]|nr:diguanylate cyclase [Gammaproteobacteria bacterium]
MNGRQDSGLVEKLQQLKQEFRAQLPERMDKLQTLYQHLVTQPDNPGVLVELHKAAHSLAGAGGSFGYHQLSDQARILEHCLSKLISAPDSADKKDLEVIKQKLHKLVTLSLAEPELESETTKIPLVFDPEYARAEAENLLYIVDDDQFFAHDLATRLTQYGYAVECYYSATEAARAVNRRIPFAMLIDVILPEGDTAGPDLVAKLAALKTYSVPLYFMSVRNDWEARLACVRAGSKEYFTKPVDINKLIDKLDQLRTQSNEDCYRILIVEDVEVLAQHYALVLRSAGHKVSIVTRVRFLFNTLTNEKAELILMDLHMPDCSGIEAAKMIRQIDEYVDVPIVFLSTESEVGEQLKAMKIGGDEFLHKPIRDDHLVAAVEIRAKRFRNLRTLMVRDSLTGLINHIALNHELERELARALREKTEMAFVMLDLDHFKNVNDQYGHQIGDKVLKTLARVLKQRLRKSDIIARYGGEEFGIILPSSPAFEAIKLIEKIRQEFSALEHFHETGSFNVSFSAGIAYSTTYHTLEDIVHAADNGLYQAKAQGRNCVVSDSQPAH